MKSLNYRLLDDFVYRRGDPIFSSQDLEMFFGAKKRAVDAFLFNNVKSGLITRLKPGLFALSKNIPDHFVLANRLVFPSYISLETALSYYGLIPEVVYSITSVTTKATKEFEVADISYTYQKIKKEAYMGYILSDFSGQKVYFAEAEKALADYLYFVSLGKKTLNDRLDMRQIKNYEKAVSYIKLFKSKKLLNLFERIYNVD